MYIRERRLQIVARVQMLLVSSGESAAPHATHKFRVLLLNARTQPSFGQTDDGIDAETSLSFFLSLFMSISLLRLFSRAHYWLSSVVLHKAHTCTPGVMTRS